MSPLSKVELPKLWLTNTIISCYTTKLFFDTKLLHETSFLSLQEIKFAGLRKLVSF